MIIAFKTLGPAPSQLLAFFPQLYVCGAIPYDVALVYPFLSTRVCRLTLCSDPTVSSLDGAALTSLLLRRLPRPIFLVH